MKKTILILLTLLAVMLILSFSVFGTHNQPETAEEAATETSAPAAAPTETAAPAETAETAAPTAAPTPAPTEEPVIIPQEPLEFVEEYELLPQDGPEYEVAGG